MNNYTLSSFLALAIRHYGGMICSIGFSVLLSRLLLPAEIGMVSQYLFLFTLCNFLSDWGVEQGTIACTSLPFQERISTHFVIKNIIGLFPLLIFLVTFFCGAAPSYPFVLFLMCLGYGAEKFGSSFRILLDQNMQFSVCAAVEWTSLVLSYVAALLCALAGGGTWSMALQYVTERTCAAFFYFSYAPPCNLRKFSTRALKAFFSLFGWAIFATSFVNLFVYDWVPFMLGRLTTPHEVGIYAKAYSLGTFPLIISAIASRMSLPFYAKHQQDLEVIGRFFVKTQYLKALFILPFSFISYWYADRWIELVFGAQWNCMTNVYKIFVIYGVSRAFYDDVINIFIYAFPRPWLFFFLQSAQAIAILLLSLTGLFWYGAMGAAITMTLAMFCVTVILWFLLWRFMFEKNKNMVAEELLEVHTLIKSGVHKGIRYLYVKG